MKLKDRANLMLGLAMDIRECVEEYVRACETKDKHMYRGEVYNVVQNHDGDKCYISLPLEATQDAIIRKIITLREQLNVMRKHLPNGGYLQE